MGRFAALGASGDSRLWRLGVALFFAQAAFQIYSASLPIYFATLGFDATLIGLLIGAAGVAELVGALMVGPGIDRFGGRAMLLAGVACYLLAALGFIVFAAVPMLVLLRLIVGFGQAAVAPSGYSFVPHLVAKRSQTVAFASLGVAANLASAVCPPLGIAILQSQGSTGLFVSAAVIAAVGGLATLTVPAPQPTRRPLALVFRSAWALPLVVGICSVVQWGVIQAFVPIAAIDNGSSPSLLFTCDAIAVLVSRIPAGWIADRYGPHRLALVGVISMSLSPVVLLLPLTNPVPAVAGILNGAGAGLMLPPMLAQLSHRSDEATRGSALAYFSVAFAVGMIVGASGGGLLYPLLGLDGLLKLGAIICAIGLLALLQDQKALRPAALLPPAGVSTPRQARR